jgi:hypothetical protein
LKTPFWLGYFNGGLALYNSQKSSLLSIIWAIKWNPPRYQQQRRVVNCGRASGHFVGSNCGQQRVL